MGWFSLTSHSPAGAAFRRWEDARLDGGMIQRKYNIFQKCSGKLHQKEDMGTKNSQGMSKVPDPRRADGQPPYAKS